MKFLIYLLISLTFTVWSCGTETDANANDSDNILEPDTNIDADVIDVDMSLENEEEATDSNEAKIISVEVSGVPDNYTFNVGVSSPDTGCDQYADWWEVITEEGELIHRRILAHSHVTEQPFVRSGSGITVSEDQVLIIRAHMNTSGYGTQVFRGSVNAGFNESIIEDTFASELGTEAPLPDGCAF